MKVVIIGTGAVGSVIVSELTKEEAISEIICGAYDLNEAKKFISESDKVKIVKLDASNVHDIIKVVEGSRLIINASLPDFNENIMEAALAVGANYQDLCSHLKDFKTAEQLKYNERFIKAGLVGLINTGVAPGITNLLARRISDKFDELDDIKIRLIEDLDSKEPIMSWSPEVVLDELNSPPLTYRDSNFVLSKPFGDSENYDFPGFGKRDLVNLYGDEVATIPLYLKLRNLDFKSGGSEIDIAVQLYNSGRLSTLSNIKVPSPKEMDEMISNGLIKNAIFVSAVEGIGMKCNEKMSIKKTIIYPDLKQISKKLKGSTYIAYPTGIAAAAFAKIIPRISTFGVFPPEALNTEFQNAIISDLERQGISIITQTSRI